MSKTRTVSIKYTSRDFDTIKRDLVDYIRRYYPNSYRDFNEAGFGSLMIDTVSYVGDILSFYLDYQANECFLDTATEYGNVIKLGQQLGYKYNISPSAVGLAAFYVLIPSLASGVGPDHRYVPILKKGSLFSTKTDSVYMLSHDVHFGTSNSEVRVARVDEVTGDPLFYAIKTYGEVVSGTVDYEFVEVGAYSKFKKIRLDSLDVSEIMSVTDAEGNEYFEVDYLSQNIIYKGTTNRSKTKGNQVVDYNTGDQAAEILKPIVVPRRFIVEKTARETTLVFGASSDFDIPNDMIAEPQTAILEKHGRDYIQDTSFDPSKLIVSDKFGVAPSNTTLTIEYRKNTTANVNCRVGSLNSITAFEMEFPDPAILDDIVLLAVQNSLEVDNEEPISGDITVPNSEELKHRIMGVFPTQNRAVTQQDYESLVYQMPPRFGSIKRCRIHRDMDSLKRNLNLYVISEDRDGSLVETNMVLKNNVKTWIQKNKMINDTVDILNAKVMNVRVDFVAVGGLEAAKYDVLEQAKNVLTSMFQSPPDIGEPLFLTDIYKELRKVESIVDVVDVKISHLGAGSAERSYSNISFDIDRAMSADGRYIEMPKNVIWEVKYPSIDINGVIL